MGGFRGDNCSLSLCARFSPLFYYITSGAKCQYPKCVRRSSNPCAWSAAPSSYATRPAALWPWRTFVLAIGCTCVHLFVFKCLIPPTTIITYFKRKVKAFFILILWYNYVMMGSVFLNIYINYKRKDNAIMLLSFLTSHDSYNTSLICYTFY